MAETLEKRVADLEKEIADLKAKVNGATETAPRPGVTGRTRPDFLERFAGIHANSPLADKVFKEIADERERERAEARRLYEEDQANP